MTPEELAFALGFGLPVTIVGMVLFYRLARLRIMNRAGNSGNDIESEVVEQRNDSPNAARLAARAADLQKRVRNLEDILMDDGE